MHGYTAKADWMHAPGSPTCKGSRASDPSRKPIAWFTRGNLGEEAPQHAQPPLNLGRTQMMHETPPPSPQVSTEPVEACVSLLFARVLCRPPSERLTAESCCALCKGQGFTLCGVEWSIICFCGGECRRSRFLPELLSRAAPSRLFPAQRSGPSAGSVVRTDGWSYCFPSNAR